jgi:hypothetical protein
MAERTWNYRVVRHKGVGVNDMPVMLQIHEVYYENGTPDMVTEDPVAAGGETIEEVRRALELMLAAIEKPILDFDSFPSPYQELQKEEHLDVKR